MGLLSWKRLRESTAVADAPALLRGGDAPVTGGGGGDNSDAPAVDTGMDNDTCPGCKGSGVKGGTICAKCSGSGSVAAPMQESTNGPYWVYSDDPEWDKLREADHPQWKDMAEAPRTFSSDVRKKYAAAGVAMPDGSYPIPDKDALGRAVASYGRNPTDAVKAHIKKRAAALNATDSLPDDWGSSSTSTKESEALIGRLEALEATSGALAADNKLFQSLREAVPKSMTPTFSNPSRVKTSQGQEGYQVILIREGRGNSEHDQWYTGDAIKEMCESGVCEGMQAYANHPTEEEEDTRPERDVKELVGSYHDVKFAESDGKAQAKAIFVPLTLDESHPRYGWVVTLAEAASRSTSPTPICGISLFGLSAGEDVDSRPDGTSGRMVSMIRPSSGDVVTNAGAGGGFIRQLMESARALRNRSQARKELNPMQSLAYQNAVREASKRVREASTDEERTAAIADLTKLETETIDNVPDSITALQEAAPKLVQQMRETVAAEIKESDGDLKAENEALRAQNKEATTTIERFTEAIGVTEALREAGVEKPVELRYYAGKAKEQGLTDAADIKEMVETDRAFQEQQQASMLEKMKESIGDIDLGDLVEGVTGRLPASQMPTDGGVEALAEVGIPLVPDAE